MNKWNANIFDDIFVSRKTMDLALNVSKNIGKLDLLANDVLERPKIGSRIFAFIESKYSSQIEGIYTTLFDNVNTGVETKHQKRIGPIVKGLFNNSNKLTKEYVQSIADSINYDVDKSIRWGKKFGIYKNNEELVYQPPTKPSVVDYEMDKLFAQLYKDKNIVNHIISHIRFEMIHPYPDGNGRVGRMVFQKQLSKEYVFNKILPISWAFYNEQHKYYEALQIAYTNMDDAIYMFLEMIDNAVDKTREFLKELKALKFRYIERIMSVSRKIDRGLANRILFTIQSNRQIIERKNNLNNRTIDNIFDSIQAFLPNNRKKVAGKVVYWNITIEEIINKHFNILNSSKDPKKE